MLVGGADNTINNHSLLYAMGHEFEYTYVGGLPTGIVPLNAVLGSLLDDFSPLAITEGPATQPQAVQLAGAPQPSARPTATGS